MKIKYFSILFTLCCLLFLLLLLGVSYHADWVTILDKIGYSVTQPTSTSKTQLMIFLTHLGDPVILQISSIIFALILWRKIGHKISLWFLFAQFVGYGLVLLVKYSIMRPRPTGKLFPAYGYSFPSGHTFATAIFALCLWTIIIPRLKSTSSKFLLVILTSLWILLIMYTRVYLRDHYASDVIGGLFLSLAWWLVLNQYGKRLNSGLLRNNS